MRGDKALSFTKKLNDFKFSEAEKKLVIQYADLTYADITRRREELGFTEFNNESPSAMDIVYGPWLSIGTE